MRNKKEKGITLVALVITIVILLILAGISISTLTNTGIFEKVKDAKKKSEDAQKELDEMFYKYEDELIKFTLDDMCDGKVNKPELMIGMEAVNFVYKEDKEEYDINTENININNENKNWYNYDEKKWANAQTEDGSMWVWIPRYAYKVVYNDPNDKSKGGVFDIVFLIGTTDNYIDENGNIQTAQRQTTKDQVIITDSTKTDKYTVHPAFTNESNIDYANGGWKKELTGIWVAKFEAGYAGINNKVIPTESKINYSQSNVWISEYESNSNKPQFESARNAYEIYGSKKTAIKYPIFQGLAYSMNYISHGDAFSISRALTDYKNIYNLDNKYTDSHLMKNSEWGAISYLGQSKYGLEGEDIYINNFTKNNSISTIYAVTGYAARDLSTNPTGDTNNVYRWTQKNGQKASCTGTVNGVYDMAGGLWERTASIVNNGNKNLMLYGSSIMNALNNGKSSEYVMVYDVNLENDNTSLYETVQNLEIAKQSNYKKNNKYGDAIYEVSNGIEQKTWYNKNSDFAGLYNCFFGRGNGYFNYQDAGIFFWGSYAGTPSWGNGFRSVLVSQ